MIISLGMIVNWSEDFFFKRRKLECCLCVWKELVNKEMVEIHYRLPRAKPSYSPFIFSSVYASSFYLSTVYFLMGVSQLSYLCFIFFYLFYINYCILL